MTSETKTRIAEINSGIVPDGYRKTKVGIVPVEWEVNQLSKYIVEYTEKTTINNQYPVLTSSRKGLMLQSEYFNNHQVTTEDNIGYNVLPRGYITFRSRTDDGNFRFNLNEIIDKGIVSYFYPVFDFSEKVDKTYMLNLLNFTIYKKYYPYVEGTAQQVMSIKKLGKLYFEVPPLAEQQKIAEILSAQDKLIELHEKKVEKLKELKKAYLQKMFPKKGSKYPEIRFKGFTDAWEQRKFGEMFERRMERNNGQFDKTKWISVAKMYFQEPEKVTSNNIDTRTYVLRKGDIAFEGHSNKEYAYGRFVANDIGDGVISELFPIYKHIDKYDLYYWKYAIQIERIMAPILLNCIEISYTSSNKLDENFFLKESVLVPSLDEQQKIGDYFRNLDTLITLHQRKLDKEKEKKKALMQLLLTGKVRVKP